MCDQLVTHWLTMFRIALSYIIEHNAAAKISTVSGMPFIVLVLLLVCVSLCSASVCVCVLRQVFLQMTVHALSSISITIDRK